MLQDVNMARNKRSPVNIINGARSSKDLKSSDVRDHNCNVHMTVSKVAGSVGREARQCNSHWLVVIEFCVHLLNVS